MFRGMSTFEKFRVEKNLVTLLFLAHRLRRVRERYVRIGVRVAKSITFPAKGVVVVVRRRVRVGGKTLVLLERCLFNGVRVSFGGSEYKLTFICRSGDDLELNLEEAIELVRSGRLTFRECMFSRVLWKFIVELRTIAKILAKYYRLIRRVKEREKRLILVAVAKAILERLDELEAIGREEEGEVGFGVESPWFVESYLST